MLDLVSGVGWLIHATDIISPSRLLFPHKGAVIHNSNISALWYRADVIEHNFKLYRLSFFFSFVTIIASFHHTDSRAAINVPHNIRGWHNVGPTSHVVTSELRSRSGDVNTFNSAVNLRGKWSSADSLKGILFYMNLHKDGAIQAASQATKARTELKTLNLISDIFFLSQISTYE